MIKRLLFFIFILLCAPSFAQVNVATSTDAATIYLGSPSILKLADGNIVVSHDFFGAGAPTNGSGKLYRSEVFESTDDGSTFSTLGTVNDLFWGGLFELSGGDLYSLGVTYRYGPIVIRKSTDGGDTWGPNTPLDSTDFMASTNKPLIHDGKVWFAYSQTATEDFNNHAVKLAFANTTSDLMNASNWTISNTVSIPSGWIGDNWSNPNMLEPSVVLLPDDTIKMMARIHSQPDTVGYAGLLDINTTSGTITANQLVNLPGGDKRFEVHTANGRMWTLTNPDVYPVGLKDNQNSRNVLALYSSTDGIHWQYHKRLIDNSDLDPDQYGDQYVSWEFDGNDIIAATRTSDAGANDSHNSNKINFYRWTDWASGWVGVGL